MQARWGHARVRLCYGAEAFGGYVHDHGRNHAHAHDDGDDDDDDVNVSAPQKTQLLLHEYSLKQHGRLSLILLG